MKIYDIFLSTPLGKKKGELKAKIENGELIGFLSLLRHTEPITGTVDESGRCSLKGKFITLLNTIDFTADGTINCDTLRLRLTGASGAYEMIGAKHKQEECDTV